MSRQSGSQCRPALLKRKRHSSDNFANIENEPVNEEKRHKDDRMHSDEAGCSSGDERMPLTELSVLRVAGGKERLDNSCRTDEQDRLSLLTDLTLLSDIDASPSPEKLSKPSPQIDDSPKLKYIGNRRCPLPKLEWADEAVLWQHFCEKDMESDACRHPGVFENHPNLQPRMRAVLLEWIIEVCDVYKLHRETYYLAMDYLDRYLNVTKNIPKAQLQLIGITCLLIASKVEEIYPPKVAEFAYVTDGACTDEEIIKMELNIVRTLDWKCAIITPNSWLCVYMQLCYKGNTRYSNMELVFPQYPGKLFLNIAQLMDLATLDIGSLQYSYSVLAASCLYIVCSKSEALNVSGLTYVDIKDCVSWLEAFWEAIQEEKNLDVPCSDSTVLPPGPNKNATLDFTHTLQTHTVSLELLEAAQAILELHSANQDSPLNLLTPPSSSKKPPASKSSPDRSIS